MRIFARFRNAERSMKSRLFFNMLLLAALLLFTLVVGLFLLGQFDSTAKNTYESLDVQMEVFEKYLTTHFDRLAAAVIRLSADTTALLETHFAENNLEIRSLNDSPEGVASVQEVLFEPLRQKMLQENCSGIFVLLNATINSAADGAQTSRSCLYLQRSSYKSSDESLFLYRGLAQVGRNHGAPLHYQWQMEWRTENFPNYDVILALSELPPDEAYFLTDCFELSGTSDSAVLMVSPMVSEDGTVLGICGYEVSGNYFMSHHAQPSKIEHLTCLMTVAEDGVLDPSAGLCCGNKNGYFREPKAEMTVHPTGSGMLRFDGDAVSYIGLTRTIRFAPESDESTLAVMMPKSDYDRSAGRYILKMTFLWMLLLFFTVSCCLYFSRRFLTPILRDLERLKTDNPPQSESSLPEIKDLFVFLEAKDRAHEMTLRDMIRDSETAKQEADRLKDAYEQAKTQYEAAQLEISRLAYSRMTEVDPTDYRNFLAGIGTLTAKERQVFDYYLEGKTVKEIVVLAGVKESTVRYHNQNIYSKLGVNSLKQLLRYAALMKQEEEQAASQTTAEDEN